ncbi:MAG: AraC family transcriptional regulator [Gammaproteobacteria bacterium]|nr:MAG: AraC family transcriptional regulator [Gammaproteobacteria bacterium]
MPMDTLSDVLNLMRLRGCVYFLRDFATPWGMDMPDGPYAQFHMITCGRCWLHFDDEYLELASGDVIVFPRGEGHRLLDNPTTAPVSGKKVLEAHRQKQPIFTEGGERTRLLCGHFEFDQAFRHPLVDELPRLIHIRGLSDQQPDWFDSVTHMLTSEAATNQPGTSTIVNRLAEVLFIQIMRAYLLRHRPAHGFLGAIQDRQINRALMAIHTGFENVLTLADIGREAGMSRSNLALRFKEVLGETLMDYLMRWRMLKAQELLKTSDYSLSDIAERVGYKSESAFSHTFKKQFGQTPGNFRRVVTAGT